MHLLAATPGAILDGSEAVDLGQTPGDIVFLSAADTELAAVSAAAALLPKDFPAIRCANLMQLQHNLSVDLYVDGIIARARVVVVRLLGGRGYWPYGVERIVAACRNGSIALVMLPGDDQPDAELQSLSTVAAEIWHLIWRYTVQGGVANMGGLLRRTAALMGRDYDWPEPAPLLRAGLYWPGVAVPSLADIRAFWDTDGPVCGLVFYRALVQAGTTQAIDSLIAALAEDGLNALPIYVHSLKEELSAETVRAAFAAAPPDVILNATGFAVSEPGAARRQTPFDDADCPVLQVVFAGTGRETWRATAAGLAARDIAMNVALPEVDGRILSRAVAFKEPARVDNRIQCAIAGPVAVANRVRFVTSLAARWATLRRTPRAARRVALILANYPDRDGRLANGVGLDTPAGAMVLLSAMREAGYGVGGLPADGNGLIALLASGPTNAAGSHRRAGGAVVTLADYLAFLDRQPAGLRDKVMARWGRPEDDPRFADGGFNLAVREFGNVCIAIQPARGYNIDPVATYHDPALVPPHNYLAFYCWLRETFAAHAVIHMGKHGNLEWLPGKSLALSDECFPEAALGPLPHVYPFIVNDPGEGTQAKRRAQAVIVDHLTPPLARAETYGPLAELERLVDEYYEAAGVDPRRLALLRDEILALVRHAGLDRDCGIADGDAADSALAKLDAYLCEIKEMQIRDGLHVFGRSPAGDQRTALLVALARIARGTAPEEQSLLRALAADFGLGAFDPLDCDLAADWTGPRPAALAVCDGAWRSNGDTVERLEALAFALVAGTAESETGWAATGQVLDDIETRLAPALDRSGAAEIAGALTALDGRFVAPGPSGAPTRGRPDVLPTGRNFYSVDVRAVPTPAAWQLGWKSAALIVERYRQDHGAWPRRLALSAWGTSNMRTGGDDIAQALALMGVRPEWDRGAGRVTGFEIMPAGVLGRPRVDVTVRLSGFFRDAFPAQIDLLDSAARAVAALDEPESVNPLAARVHADATLLMEDGVDAQTARRRAAHRVFGSKPGGYGAGLQTLIDSGAWEEEGDLARAYIAWGGYAYGGGVSGAAEHRLFEARLAGAEAVLHNQDNREHDLLDSDDYYQFEGGMAAAVRHLSGSGPTVYHNDHSRPETPRVRTLEDEIGRVVRARVVNPKWIAGVRRHGYKGGFEMAATVDYLFAFAATTGAVANHHFDLVFDAYLGDDGVRGFLVANNRAALREMAARLLEAEARGLWRPRSNTAHGRLAALAQGESG